MKQSSLIVVVALAAAAVWSPPLAAQELTIGDLKTKGAVQLSADDLKTLLTGATAHYETNDYTYQQRFQADGTVAGSFQKSIAASRTLQFTGEWRVSEDGRWCGVQHSYRSNEVTARYCRDVLKLGEQYYYASGDKNNDARPVRPINFRR